MLGTANSPYIYNGTDITHSGGTISFSSGDDIEIEKDVTLQLAADMTAKGITVKGDNVTLELDGYELNASNIKADPQCSLRIDGGGGRLKINTNSATAIYLKTGDLVIENLNSGEIISSDGDGIDTDTGSITIRNITNSLTIAGDYIGIKTVPGYGSNYGDITIQNVGFLKVQGRQEGIDARGDLLIENVQVEATSQDRSGIDAEDITIINSKVTAKGTGNDYFDGGIVSGGTITISGADTVVTATSNGTGQDAAITAKDDIVIDAPLGIETPAGGVVGNNANAGGTEVFKSTLESDGTTVAKHAVIKQPSFGGDGGGCASVTGVGRGGKGFSDPSFPLFMLAAWAAHFLFRRRKSMQGV